MIKINEDICEIKKVIISNDLFSGRLNGRKIKAKTPYITFDLNDNRVLSIETIYPISWLHDLKLNSKIELKDYISDLLYSKGEDLDEMFFDIVNCTLEKLSDSSFRLEFICNYIDDLESAFKLEIDEVIEINC